MLIGVSEVVLHVIEKKCEKFGRASRILVKDYLLLLLARHDNKNAAHHILGAFFAVSLLADIFPFRNQFRGGVFKKKPTSLQTKKNISKSNCHDQAKVLSKANCLLPRNHFTDRKFFAQGHTINSTSRTVIR